METGGSQVIEELYETPMSEYIVRLSQACADVRSGMCTLDEAMDLYKVSGVDLRQLYLEQAEWHKYVRQTSTGGLAFEINEEEANDMEK